MHFSPCSICPLHCGAVADVNVKSGIHAVCLYLYLVSVNEVVNEAGPLPPKKEFFARISCCVGLVDVHLTQVYSVRRSISKAMSSSINITSFIEPLNSILT